MTIMVIFRGIAVMIPQRSDAVDSLIELADQALYKAKEQGRNTIVLHQP